MTKLEVQQNLKCEEDLTVKEDIICEQDSNCEGNSNCDQTKQFKEKDKTIFQSFLVRTTRQLVRLMRCTQGSLLPSRNVLVEIMKFHYE